MKRNTALLVLLVLLIAAAIVLPLSVSSAHHGRRHKGRRYHSRAWRQRHEAARNRRAHTRLADAELSAAPLPYGTSAVAVPAATGADQSWRLSVPAGWAARATSLNGVLRFPALAANNTPAGQATLSVITEGRRPLASATARDRNRMLGGISFSDLRRDVINQMLAADGWVTNDVEREVGGRPVYVVTARTSMSRDGRTPEQSWAVYFTEVDGHIYRLVTNTPLDYTDRMAAESEQLLSSLAAAGSPVQGTSGNK